MCLARRPEPRPFVCSLAPAVLAEVEALPAEQALALLLLPAIGQAHVLAGPPPPNGARHTAATGVKGANQGQG